MTDFSVLRSSNDARPIRVLKFGGTSVGDAIGLRHVTGIVAEAAKTCRPVIVTSAAAGVTDDLVRAADEAVSDPSAADTWARRIGRRYLQLAHAALDDEALRTPYGAALHAHLTDLHRALRAVDTSGTSAARDAVLATGERLMVPLLAAVLTQAGCAAHAVDATRLIRTNAIPGGAAVDLDATGQQIRQWQARRPADRVPVVTGFIGATGDGVTTTLGRGGSDYSAALLARGLGAERLERWTDVDGLYTRDPNRHDDARRLDRVEFEQALAWTHDGRLGLHPNALDPLADTGIPMHVRCTRVPEAPGSQILPAVRHAIGS